MARLRLGLIGAGIAARDLHAPALKELRDRFEVVAVASRTADKAQAIAALHGEDIPVYTDYADLLARRDLDAVVVAVPIELNLQVTRDCLVAGKAVALEKPLGANMAEAAEVVALAEEGRATLFVLENFRYWPDLQQARKMVEAGVIGQLALIRWNTTSYMGPDNKYVGTGWRRQPAHLGGYLSDGGVHLAAGLQVLGGPVESVQAVTTTIQPYLGGVDTMLMNLRFRSGVLGQTTQCYGGVDHESRRPKLYGDQGTLVLSREQIDLWLPDGSRQAYPVEGPYNYVAEFVALHEALTSDDRSASFTRAAYEDLRLIDAAIRAAETGDTVRL